MRFGKSRARYVLFGTGDYYKRFCHWFKHANVIAVLDNDEKKQGNSIDGYPIISPEMIQKLSYDVIVILSFYVKEMRQQLMDLGVEEGKIYHFYDLKELMEREGGFERNSRKSILLLSHDLSFGGPSLALYHAAIILKKSGYEVVYASMLDGELRKELIKNFIPVIIDERLQISTMKELIWTQKYDLVICNTINYHTFLLERKKNVPVIWWLHDTSFYYEGIKPEKIEGMDNVNLKYLSVGPIPKSAMKMYQPDIMINDLIYGVSEDI